MMEMFIKERCRPTLPDYYKANDQNPSRILFIDMIEMFIMERCRLTPRGSYKDKTQNPVTTLFIDMIEIFITEREKNHCCPQLKLPELKKLRCKINNIPQFVSSVRSSSVYPGLV